MVLLVYRKRRLKEEIIARSTSQEMRPRRRQQGPSKVGLAADSHSQAPVLSRSQARGAVALPGHAKHRVWQREIAVCREFGPVLIWRIALDYILKLRDQ